MNDQEKHRPRTHARKRYALYLSAFLGAITALVLGNRAIQERNPAGYEVLDHSLVITGGEGRIAWSHIFERSLRKSAYGSASHQFRCQFEDLDEDELNEVIFVAAFVSRHASDEIYVFDDDGRLMSGPIEIGRELHLVGARVYANEFILRDLFLIREDSAQPTLLYLATHREYSPSLVRLVSFDGQVLREFVHYGRLKTMLLWDVNGDGVDEIVCGGIHQLEQKPVLVVLEMEDFGGASPLPASYNTWRAAGTPAEGPLLDYYILLGNIDFPEKKGSYALEIVPENDRLRVSVSLANRDVVYYFFERRFLSWTTSFKNETRLFYENWRLKTDPSLPSAEEREKQLSEAVRFWNGLEWTAEPVAVAQQSDM